MRTSLTRAITLSLLLALPSACTSLQTVRLQPDAIDVGPGLRPIAGIQANAISAYILFIPIPGVDLNKAVNQMLVVAAKTMGADKIANLQFEITPDGGFWAWRKLIGWRSAQASGIAVQLTAPALDVNQDLGPEPPGSSPTSPDSGDPPVPRTVDTAAPPPGR